MPRELSLPARTARAITFTLLTTLLALFLLIQFQQHLLRHRAERLHAQILQLQLHPGTFTDLQTLQKEWGRFAHYYGPCTAAHCIYQITFRNFYDYSEKYGELQQFFFRHGRLLGYRPSKVIGEIRVHDNRVWGADFSLAILVRGTNIENAQTFEENGYAMLTQINYGPHMQAEHYASANAFLEQGYLVAGPSGCEGCLETWVHLTPQASPEVVLRLNQIDLSCLSRFRQCTTMEQLLPAAASERKREQSLPEDFETCSAPISTYAREADNIFEGSVTSTRLHHFSPGYDKQISTLLVTRLIKNSSRLKEGELTDIQNIQGHLFYPGSQGMEPGAKLLLMFNNDENRHPDHQIDLWACSVLSSNPVTIGSVMRGVNEDTSAGEQYRHFASDWPPQ